MAPAARRRAMVAAVRRGQSQRSVARAYRVSLCQVQYWVRRAGDARLDRVDFDDRSRRPQRTRRTPRALEERILSIRHRLKRTSPLGEYGAAAIARELEGAGLLTVPAVRTIGRILDRRGALDPRGRVRRAPPPPGWYLPELARGAVELDSFDVIEGLALVGGRRLEVLTALSLYGALPAAWPMAWVSARAVVPALLAHWREVGLPSYAQFDNDTIFQGPHQHRDSISRVMRLCLGLGVVPVFTPPRETGFQAAIESFNGRWQAKVWARWRHRDLAGVRWRSAQYIAAARVAAALRIEAAPPRPAVPAEWELDLQRPPRGLLMFLRRTDADGAVHLLGRTFPADHHWPHRLVRAEVDLAAGEIRLHALRRREPTDQPLLRRLPYALPDRQFKD
jgi:hypothetical protein